MAQVQQVGFSKGQVNAAASAINVLSKYVNGDTKAIRVAKARKIIQDIIESSPEYNNTLQKSSKLERSLLEIEGTSVLRSAWHKQKAKQMLSAAGSYPDNSYTDTPVDPSAKDITPSKSQYPNLTSCIEDMKSQGLNLANSERICAIYFDDSTDTKSGCANIIQKLVNAGKSVGEARSIAGKMYGIKSGERIETKERMPTGNMGKGGWVSTRYPGPNGFSKKAKSASIEDTIPYHVWATNDTETISRLENLPSESSNVGVRSAAVQEEVDDALSMSGYALQRKSLNRQARREANHRLLSASSDVPDWATVLRSIKAEVQ
jgi:hypothetical protein